MRNGRTQLVAIILSAVIAFSFGLGGGIAADYLLDNGIINLGTKTSQTVESPASSTSALVTKSGSAEDPKNITISVNEDATIAEAIAAKVSPSVVGITTTYSVASQSSGFSYFFGFGGGNDYSYDATGVGTGIIVDEAGYVLTNSHVVNDGDYKSITVSLYDGSTVDGTLLWNEPTLDLAIVKIEADDLVAAELGNSDELQVGSYAAVIGNPLGLAFERSMTQGIISGLNRSITASDGSYGKSTLMEGLIQTDATINSGNSGGPLLNSRGQVVGIASARASAGENMGFAIPINIAKPIVDQIKSTGSYSRPYIGITGIGLGEQKSYTEEQLEEYFGTTSGIYVNGILEDGGAEAAGIKKGDIILKLNGTEVNTMNKLNSLLVAYDAGDEITLEVLRDGKTLSFTVTLTGTANNVIEDPEEEPPYEEGQHPQYEDEPQFGEMPEKPEDTEQAPGRRGRGSFGGEEQQTSPNGD